MNAASWLLEGSRRRPDALAMVLGNERLTHRDFLSRVERAATLLEGYAGERVATLSSNSPDAAAVLLATILVGAVAVPLAPGDPKPRLAKMLARANVKAIFTTKQTSVVATDLAPAGARVFAATDFPLEPKRITPAVSPSEALILFTSGSTGEPRGVVLSHRNIIANTTSILASLPIEETDRMMAVLPFYYSFGASVLFTHVRAGAALVINNQFMFADKVLAQMNDEKCTSFAGVPSTYQLLLRRSSLPKMSFPHLRYVQQAGGRLAPTFVRELRERLPTTQIWLMYGQTEATARLTCLDPAFLETKMHTIGRAIPGVTLEVRRPDGTLANVDEVGELVARGDNIALGYLDDPDATAESFRSGGALYTGDLGMLDPDGFLVIVDRAKDFLKAAGYRVAMKEIEDVLLGFDGMIEAAVVGIPDELQGEAVQAFVVHRDGEEARDSLDAYCKKSLASHVQPKVTRFVDALPKTAAGKLARAELKRMV